MKIHILSDLHTELGYPHNRYLGPIESVALQEILPSTSSVRADVTVLAGDITSWSKRYELHRVLQGDEYRYSNFLYIPGNHEYYGCRDARRVAEDYELLFATSNSNVTVLNNRIVTLPEGDSEVAFLGTTLWTDLSDPRDEAIVTRYMNDFRQPGFTPELYKERHREALVFLKTNLQRLHSEGKKTVVVTHHVPTYRSMHPKFSGDPGNAGFISRLDNFFEQEWSPDLWIHGHTHTSFDYMYGKTRVVCNPHGYGDENLHGEVNEYLPRNPGGFNPNLVVEI